MKKTYIKPVTTAVPVNMHHTLLAGSGGVNSESLLGNDFISSDVTYSPELYFE
jgi:hypothetical protein